VESRAIFASKIPFDVSTLIPYFDNADDVWIKETGPKTVSLENFLKSDRWPELKEFVSDTLRSDFVVVGGNFFMTNKPYIIHTDGKFQSVLENENFYNVVIPLKIQPEDSKTQLIIFEQTYYGVPTKFVFGDKTEDFIITSYPYKNNHDEVLNLNQASDLVDEKHLGHLRKNWLEGMSIKLMLDWNIGEALFFPSEHLHCSSCFKFSGVKNKLGLSLFIRKINY
jgi:hypothetical protein